MGKLMIDQYGNYFCQKLLHNVSSEQRLKILRALQKDFVTVSCDEVGTHPMQRLIEMINLDEERECVFHAIKGDIVNMAFHHKGNYVLLLTLQALRGEQLSYVIDHLLDQVYPLALDQYGICIVNKIIQLSEKEE